jgi:hypothetical protein
MTAHHVLAAVELRDGDRVRALEHMRESVKVPSVPGCSGDPRGPHAAFYQYAVAREEK